MHHDRPEIAAALSSGRRKWWRLVIMALASPQQPFAVAVLARWRMRTDRQISGRLRVARRAVLRRRGLIEDGASCAAWFQKTYVWLEADLFDVFQDV
jgi:hypothetical protein